MSRIIESTKVSVVPPPQEEWKSFQFNVHEFAALDATKGHYFCTPEFPWSERRWALKIYPGGKIEATEGSVSAYLENLSEESTAATFRITILDKFGDEKNVITSAKKEFNGIRIWGWKNWIPRSVILDQSQNILDRDGTFAVVVAMKEEIKQTGAFIPKNPFNKMVMKNFNDEETADICFEVSSSHDTWGGKEKRAKSSVSFHAHRFILKSCAPMLADICKSTSDERTTVVSITDIKPDIFNHLLHYVYGGSVAKEDLNEHAKDIIDAADKYGVVNLKLEAEAFYVESTAITIDNALDNLLYSDAKNCALLKETVMDFIAENGTQVIGKISFNDVPGHLMNDLLVATTRSKKLNDNVTNDLNTMRVSELRRKLHEKGLNVDGSREAMIEALKSDSS